MLCVNLLVRAMRMLLYWYDIMTFGCQSIEEPLHSNKDSAVQNHINVCQSCKDSKHFFDKFSILKTCNTQYSVKIQEALLIKKHNPKLNTQLYPNDSSFLLNAF